MRRGLLISFFLHIFVAFVAFINVPEVFFPKNEVKAISIKLVAAKNVKKTTKVEKQKAVKTQQSAAPKAANKPKEKPKPKPKEKPKKPTLVKEIPQKNPKKAKKKLEVVEKTPKKVEPKKVENKPESRPAKLDKTPDKKNIIKEANKDAVMVEDPDDFLKALSFIEDLKAEESAMFEGEETERTTINVAEQAELAVLKKHIERNWYKTPGTKFSNALLLRLKINRDGTLASLEVIESSGSTSLDNSLKRAARKAAPFPIPSDKYELFKEIDLYWNG
ncbi:MAG: TonB family protein [bacterium]|jgi:TonB family protein